MPVLRYFLYVGGALLALLLVFNAVIPASPVDQQNVASATPAEFTKSSDWQDQSLLYLLTGRLRL